MNTFQSIIVGIVQGLTEFLPISSTAHMRIVPALMGWSDPGAAYSAIIQLGTTAAVLVYFSKDIQCIARAWLTGLVHKKPWDTPQSRMGWYIILGTLPVVVFGFALKHYIENQFRSLYVIAWAAIGLAVILAVAEKVATRNRTIEHLTWKDGFWIGLAQVVSLIPGSSRSGTTLTGGLFLGFQREAAARFSFLLSIPATAGAGVFEMRHVFAEQSAVNLNATALIMGTLCAFAFGYLSIASLLRFLRSRSTLVFIVYRIVLGAALLVLLAYGYLHP